MIEISLDTKFKALKIGGEDYELRGFSGYDREQYEDKQKEACKYETERTKDDNGKEKVEIHITGLNPTAGLESWVISKCLFKGKGDKAVQVDESVIRAWPSEACSKLYEECKSLNKLDKIDEELQEKN